MCIAILNKKGLLTQTDFINAWRVNDDGGGMLWVQDGELEYFKLSPDGTVYTNRGSYSIVVEDEDVAQDMSHIEEDDTFGEPQVIEMDNAQGIEMDNEGFYLPCHECPDYDCKNCQFLDAYHKGNLNGMSLNTDTLTPTVSAPSEKELVDYMYSYYLEIRETIDEDSPILIHFRITTSGYNDKGIHPHLVDETLGLIHNGIFTGLGDNKMSDTIEFAEIINLHSNPNDFVFNEPMFFERFMDEFGKSNKVIFLNTLNQYKIYGESRGHWVGDNWYSNYSCNNYSSSYPESMYYGRGGKNYNWDY